MIDRETYNRFSEACTTAQQSGLALVEVLDKRGLLLTSERRKSIQMNLLDDVARRLGLQSAHKIMSYYYERVEGTPAEMFVAMKMWLDTVIRNVQNRTLDNL